MALDPAGVQLVAQDANQFFGDMDRAERAVHSFSDATEKSGGRVGAAGEMMIGAFRRVGAFGVEMLAEAGRALFDFGVDSIGVAGDFEAGMNRFEAAAGDIDASGLEEFRDLFLDIGKELPVSTGDVQDAAIELVKGGLDPAILSAGGLKDAIQFAAAAELDLAEAATIAVKQLGVWTDATATAEEQTAFLAMSQDLLVRAAGASTVNVDKLNAAMNNAGGQARALNLDYKDFVTGLTLVSPAFGSAEQAGTGFNVFLKQLQPSTDPATAAMQELGLWTEETGSAFFDAQGQYIGNREAAELLKQATEGLTDAKKAELLQTIFGIDGMVTANTLAAQGAEGYDILAGKIENASGVQATAALKQAGYNTALDNAKGSLEAMQITLGSKLLPVLTTFLNDYISPGINAITEFADRIFGASDPVAALTSEIDQLIPGFAGVVDTVQEVVNWFTTASDETSVLSQLASDLASGALQFLTNAWNEDVLPAIQVVSAFFVSSVLPILGNLAETVLPILNSALQVAAGFWENVLVPALELAWNLITAFVVPVLTEVTGWLKENLPPAVQLVADFLTETLFPALNTVYTFMNDNVVPILKALAEVWLAAAGKALEALAGLWENVLGPALEDLWEFVDQNIVPVLEDFAEWLGEATGGMEGITGAVKTAIDWLGDLAETISNLELPDWLTPGSPTPLELGLLGIADALRDVVRGGNLFGASLDDINSALETTSGLVADAFGGQADMFRGQADNMEQLEEMRDSLSAMDFAVLQTSLNRALEESKQFTDPQQAAEYYDLLSRQAFELADIRQQIAETEDHAERERLYDRMRLIQQAQQAEIAAFQERARSADNPLQALHAQIQDILLSFDDAGSPQAQALFQQLSQLASFLGGAPAPPANGQQMYGMASNSSTTNNWNFGVTTNNSPAMMWQSYQMAMAMAQWGP